MQAAISTELLTLLFRASPEQVAAIELILGCGVLEKEAEPTGATENGLVAALLQPGVDELPLEIGIVEHGLSCLFLRVPGSA